jgi:hypothetical protein
MSLTCTQNSCTLTAVNPSCTFSCSAHLTSSVPQQSTCAVLSPAQPTSGRLGKSVCFTSTSSIEVHVARTDVESLRAINSIVSRQLPTLCCSILPGLFAECGGGLKLGPADAAARISSLLPACCICAAQSQFSAPSISSFSRIKLNYWRSSHK